MEQSVFLADIQVCTGPLLGHPWSLRVGKSQRALDRRQTTRSTRMAAHDGELRNDLRIKLSILVSHPTRPKSTTSKEIRKES